MSLLDKAYGSKTYGSKDPLRKYSHGSRFEIAASLFNVSENDSVLDFGGGDGAFLNLLHKRVNVTFDSVLFEPFMDVRGKCNFTITKKWDEVEVVACQKLFDIVICQEVMEHFSTHRQVEALNRIASVMTENGILIVSVPVEIGPVALLKNVARWKYRKKGDVVYNYLNLLRTLFGLPIPQARFGDGYLSHMGFYYKDLHKLLSHIFIVDFVKGSPWPKMPLLLNSQVFFYCRLRP